MSGRAVRGTVYPDKVVSRLSEEQHTPIRLRQKAIDRLQFRINDDESPFLFDDALGRFVDCAWRRRKWFFDFVCFVLF